MGINETALYMVNPDVSCREEGPDGALLFNPDTNDVLVINVTGLLIWQALTTPRRAAQTIEALKRQCENVPEEAVAQDVYEFMEQLLDRGFVGLFVEGGYRDAV